MSGPSTLQLIRLECYHFSKDVVLPVRNRVANAELMRPIVHFFAEQKLNIGTARFTRSSSNRYAYFAPTIDVAFKTLIAHRAVTLISGSSLLGLCGAVSALYYVITQHHKQSVSTQLKDVFNRSTKEWAHNDIKQDLQSSVFIYRVMWNTSRLMDQISNRWGEEQEQARTRLAHVLAKTTSVALLSYVFLPSAFFTTTLVGYSLVVYSE
jgi:hypothetical protein